MLVVRTAANRPCIAACCDRAARAGVRPGMTLAEARALLRSSDVRLEEDDPARDAKALAALAHWSTRYLPRVAVDAAGDGLLAEITGCERLYRGEPRLLRQLRQAMQRLGLRSRLAAAPTFGAAWALARHGPRTLSVTVDDKLPEALADLPVAGLRVDEATVDALAEVGVRTIGQMRHLPRAELPARFSDELLLRLDQALGRTLETIDPVRPRRLLQAERRFPGPVVSLEGVMQSVRQLVAALCEQLAAQESGARRLRLILERYQAEPLEIHQTVSRASRDAGHLWSLLAPKVERAHLGHGVEAVTLTASETARLQHRQYGAERADADRERACGELVDVLEARLGSRRVRTLEARQTHTPERVYRTRSAGLARRGRLADVTPHERPSRLLHPPRRVEVLARSPDGPVVRLCDAGRPYAIRQCHGPERLSGAWWRGERFVRDYYRLQEEGGRWLWVFREEATGRWFLHGWWS